MIGMSEQVILVTGAAGFSGFHVAQRLLEAGRRVVGFDNLNNYFDPVLKQARVDILDDCPGSALRGWIWPIVRRSRSCSQGTGSRR
jgi:nucleoside-diphosphate-sugar epimerase